MKNNFEGIFTKEIECFVRQKRSFGYIYLESERILFAFQQFCLKNYPNATTLTKEIALKWSEQRISENNSSRLNRISSVREFAKYLNSIGESAYVIPTELTRKTQRHVPHIYSMDELAAIFQSMDRIQFNPRSPAIHLIIPVIFRLIYCCGLRPVEARRLLVEDIDLRTGKLKILESKGHRDRIVMLSKDLLILCQKYHEKIEAIFPSRQYFFQSCRKTGMLSKSWINKIFKKHLTMAGLDRSVGIKPTLYHLRHTFATHRLYRWMQEGQDMNAVLPYLSEYMGHKMLSDTAYYIHLIPEFFSQMTGMELDNYTTFIPEVHNEN